VPHTLCLLDTVPTHLARRHTQPVALLVMQPDTVPLYDTTQIIYTDRAHEIGYFSRYVWAETPSKMLLPLIVQTLQATHYFSSIATAPSISQFNYVLKVQIQKLQQNLIARHPMVELAIEAQLYSLAEDRIVAAKSWHITQPMRAVTPENGVIAFNQATSHWLTELASFVTTSV